MRRSNLHANNDDHRNDSDPFCNLRGLTSSESESSSSSSVWKDSSQNVGSGHVRDDRMPSTISISVKSRSTASTVTKGDERSSKHTRKLARKKAKGSPVSRSDQDTWKGMCVDHDETVPLDTALHKNPAHVTSSERRKSPRTPRNFEEAKEYVEMMHKQNVSEKLEQQRLLFEQALSDQQKNCGKTSSKINRPKLVTRKKVLPVVDGDKAGSYVFDRHPLIVNSSLKIYPTADDRKMREKSEELEIRTKAESLSLMPYHYNNLQEEFVSILDELPSEYRHHKEIHQITSRLLDPTPPVNSKETLDPPSRFKTKQHSIEAKKASASPKTKADEDDSKYESVMMSFRDFCVQCKTFDCEFHIVAFPDPATQASVAIRYDKRALVRHSRRDEDSDDDESHDEHLPSVIVDGIPATRKGETCCPFCDFPCQDGKRMMKHLKRYHTDMFTFEDELSFGGRIIATSRPEDYDSITPIREYLNSKSFAPLEKGHCDRDFDEESVYSWYKEHREKLIGEIIDMTENEKRIQTMWNGFVGYHPTVITDKIIARKCYSFVRKFSSKLKELEWEFYQLLITFWERHLLSVIQVEKLMLLYHAKARTGSSGQKETHLTPRKRTILSRLHMIYESLDDHMPRLQKAMRLTRISSHDLRITPVLTNDQWPKSIKKRTFTSAMRMRSEDVSKPFFYPCFHAGECTAENGCTCIKNGYLCTKHCIWGEYGVNFFPGCNCRGDCSDAKQCPCRDSNRECDPDVCKCSASKVSCCNEDDGCSNMDVSLAKRVPLLIGKSTVKGGGLGLFTKNDLGKGDYVDEYIGEFIKREHEGERANEYYFDHSDDYVVDATYQGNQTRFVNHSLTPNIEARHRFVNGEKRIAFYALHDIPAQTELFYSYGKSYNKIWRSKGFDELCVKSDDEGYETRDS